MEINPELKSYVEEEIIPRYDNFDKGHQRDHVTAVIAQALSYSQYYPVDVNMVYTAAAFHDTGLCKDRETHHIESARIIRADAMLPRWFSKEQIDLIADAAEDHRASAKNEPRTIYGKIVAEADRLIIPETIVRRTIQFSLSHFPDYTKEEHWARTLEHLHEKYAEGGYLKLWIPESPNAARMKELHKLIADVPTLRSLFDNLYENIIRIHE